MARKWRLSIYDINGNRLCPLFDTDIPQDGSAQSIKRTRGLDGWKEISFNLSRKTSDGQKNFRYDFVRPENLVYVDIDGERDVYCIKEPSDIHDNTKAYITVSCVHISGELKTKNLFMQFDDENGIDTCRKLVEKAVSGTGWEIRLCDTFFEANGSNEKIRSYSCETKTGAFNMLSEICKLFNARPVFHGYTKTIDILSIYNTSGWMEIMFGKNTDKIQRTSNSDNLITRLYVEGEYGDNGYVGIDSVNPTGLSFILNFDYYKDLGLFTDDHQAIVDQYINECRRLTTRMSESTAALLAANGKLSELIGNYGYAYYPVKSGQIDFESRILGNSISSSDAELSDGGTVAVVSSNGQYEYVEYSNNLSLNNKIAIIKSIPTITGLLAAYEDIEEAASGNISMYLEKINAFLTKNEYSKIEDVNDLKEAYSTNDLSKVKDESFNLDRVEEQYRLTTILDYVVAVGGEETKAAESLKNKSNSMLSAIDFIKKIDFLQNEYDNLAVEQIENETDFNVKMGSMLRDGYWSDDKYAIGQEETLYADALMISKRMAYPIVTYSAGVQNLSRISKYKDEEFDIAQTIRMYDPDMGINDYGIVSKFVDHADSLTSDSIEISTDVLDIGNKTFASILERVTEMAERVRQGREIYERAVAISKNGTIRSDILEGAIDVLKTKLLSSASNWQTDENGNIVLEAIDGSSAMMLCGGGFMCANTKTASGNWNWRTFGTGDGFTADMIIAGYLNAERIEARSITVDHLSPNIGTDVDISKNTSIQLVDGKISLIVSDETSETRLVLTEEAIRAISENIYIRAEKINAIADDIDLSSNKHIKLSVSDKNATFYSKSEPLSYSAGDTWIDSETGVTYLAHGMTGKNAPDIQLTPEFVLVSSSNDEDYLMIINDSGELLSADPNVKISEDGYLEAATVWKKIAPVELHTSYIDIEQDRIAVISGGSINIAANSELNVGVRGAINIDTGADLNVHAGGNINVEAEGNVNIGAGGSLNVESGAVHFKTDEYTLSILSDDGSEDTIMDFDSESKVLRVTEVEAKNARPYITGITEVSSGDVGGLDGLKGMLESKTYEHLVYTQTQDDASTEPVEIEFCDSFRVDIISTERKTLPPVVFRNTRSNIYFENLKWVCSKTTALNVDSGNYILKNCIINAKGGIHASMYARVTWIGADSSLSTAGKCVDFMATAVNGADVRLYGLIPTGATNESLAGKIMLIDTRTAEDETVVAEKTTETLTADLGYYGASQRPRWNPGVAYQGYSNGKGKIYGCISFNFPAEIKSVESASLTLHRDDSAGRGSAADVHIYGSTTEFGSDIQPELVYSQISREDAAAPGASCSFDVTEAINDMLSGKCAQFVLYTGESTVISGKVYSKQYAKFDSAKLKITY